MAIGRPPHYKKPEDLQAKVDEYFKPENEPHLVTGLALFLGFVNYKSMYDYRDKRGKTFSDIIKKALAMCENEAVERLIKTGGAAGEIFHMKNIHGWKDQQDHNHTGGATIVLQSSIPEPQSVKED